MRKFTATFLSFLFGVLLSFPLQAQVILPIDTVSFTEGINEFKFPFAGGLNLPQFSPIDLNQDGTEDIFIFERNSNKVLTFLNGGTAGVVDYQYAPEYEAGFPEMDGWVKLADYNCDGLPDIFTGYLNGVRVYKNTSTPTEISFELITNALESNYGVGKTPIFILQEDVPEFVDVDEDGDLDLLTFDAVGYYVEFHENKSADLGNCDTLEFLVAAPCWGFFVEAPFGSDIDLDITCRASGLPPVHNPLVHSGSTICAIDDDSDGDKDLIIGDLIGESVIFLHNDGTPTAAHMDQRVLNFPDYDTPIDLNLFPAVFHLDVNNDGMKDLIAAPNAQSISNNYDNVWQYNSITGPSPGLFFQHQSNRFLQDDMIDIGAGALPVIFDHNADGLLDILVGNETLKSPTFDRGTFSLFENVGSIDTPAFDLVTRDFQDISTLFTPSLFGLAPTIGDLDNDGDIDLLFGDHDGKFHWFENTAGAGNPVDFSLPHYNFMGMDVGLFSTPFLVDLDRDGLLDIVSGESRGNLNFFKNIGTATDPLFASTPDSDTLGSVDTQVPCCGGYSVPFIYEDSVGDYQLLVGSEEGGIFHYDDIEGNVFGSYALVDPTFAGIDVGIRSTITGADLNDDGNTDWIVGNFRGGLGLFGTPASDTTIIESRPKPIADLGLQLFPNPSNGILGIQLDQPFTRQGTVEIISMTGQIVASYLIEAGKSEIQLETNVPSGLYIVKVSDTEHKSGWKRWVKEE